MPSDQESRVRRLEMTVRLVGRLAGALFGAALGGIVSLFSLLFDLGGGWVFVPPGVGLVVGFFGGDRGLYALMRFVGKL